MNSDQSFESVNGIGAFEGVPDDKTPEAQAAILEEPITTTHVQATTLEDAMLLATEDFENPEWQEAFRRAAVRKPDTLTAALARVARAVEEDPNDPPSQIAQSVEETVEQAEEMYDALNLVANVIGRGEWIAAREVSNAFIRWRVKQAESRASQAAELRDAYRNLTATQKRCGELLEENRKLSAENSRTMANDVYGRIGNPAMSMPAQRAEVAARLFSALDHDATDDERPVDDELTKAACKDVRAIMPTKWFEEAETVVLLLKSRWSYAPALYTLGRKR